MTKKPQETAVERERAITVAQLDAKRRAVSDINRAIANLERERREAQVMVDYYYDALCRSESGSKLRRRKLGPVIDYRTLGIVVARHLRACAETMVSAARQLVMYADDNAFGRCQAALIGSPARDAVDDRSGSPLYDSKRSAAR